MYDCIPEIGSKYDIRGVFSIRRILGISEQPWNTPFMSSILKELKYLTNDEVKLALTDQFYFIHGNVELKQIRLKSNFEIMTLESSYVGWQEACLNMDRVSEAEAYISQWLERTCPKRSREVLEKTNQYIFGNEREFFYLPLQEKWRAIVFADTIKWCEKVLENFNPSLVISLERSSLGINIFYEICRSRSIPFQTLIYSRIGSRWVIRDDFGYGMSDQVFEDVMKSGNKRQLDESVESEIRDMLENRQGAYVSFAGDIVSNLQTSRRHLLSSLKIDLRAFMSGVYNRFVVRPRLQTIQPRRLEQDYIKLTLWLLKGLIYKYAHVIGLRNWGETQLPPQPYFAWALHMRPEGSVSVLGNGIDEIELLLHCAEQIPDGTLIVVKENPEMFGFRNKGFYQKLVNHPRIKLIDFSFPSYELIRNALGVVGISGTFLLESTLLGVPACALGEPEFSRCLSAHGLPALEGFIEKCIEGTCDNSKDLMKAYVAYVLERSDANDIPWFSDSTSPRLEETAQRIASRLVHL